MVTRGYSCEMALTFRYCNGYSCIYVHEFVCYILSGFLSLQTRKNCVEMST